MSAVVRAIVMNPKAFLFYFYVPIEEKELVKAAVFKVHGGEFSLYDSCSFEYAGVGQFRALVGADPFVGEMGELTMVKEIKVEMMVQAEHVEACKKAMLEAHPYEEVAFGFLPIYHI